MIYSTVTHNSGGNHGHQAEDLFSAIAYAEMMGYKFLYQPYPYLDFLGLQNVYPDLKEELGEDEVVWQPLKGPHWFGLSYFQCFDWGVRKGAKFKDDPNRHIVAAQEKAFRVGVCNLIQWAKLGWVDQHLFDDLTTTWRDAYESHNQHRSTPLFDPAHRNVAIHIARGRDIHNRHRPSESQWPAYIFPMSYWENIIKSLRELSGLTTFHVFTERTNSEEVVDALEGYSAVRIHLGPDRKSKKHAYIHDVLHHFIKSDVFVASNSWFSNIALYLRNDFTCKNIYHPNVIMHDLPHNRYKPTDLKGNFPIYA